MSKVLTWVGIVVIVLGVLLWWGKSHKSVVAPKFEVDKISHTDHVKGNASSTVVIVEYSDFQCPACRSYYPIMREVMAEFGNKVALVYRHFPLTTIHKNAEISARAAEAAGKQGKFWEMHDLLFEKQNEWSESNNPLDLFISYANLIGLSVDQFKVDINSNEIKDLVRAERNNALKIGLQGTPTFFVKGNKIENPRSVAEFKEIIKKALAQ